MGGTLGARPGCEGWRKDRRRGEERKEKGRRSATAATLAFPPMAALPVEVAKSNARSYTRFKPCVLVSRCRCPPRGKWTCLDDDTALWRRFFTSRWSLL